MKNNNLKLKNKSILFIDTSSNQKISVCLVINGRREQVEQIIGIQKAQVVLPLLEKLLKKHTLKTSDITQIEVNAGPGSFTGLRVGVSIANALSFALKIPVNRKKIGQFVEPVY